MRTKISFDSAAFQSLLGEFIRDNIGEFIKVEEVAEEPPSGYRMSLDFPWTYSEFVQAGWTDEQMIQFGALVPSKLTERVELLGQIIRINLKYANMLASGSITKEDADYRAAVEIAHAKGDKIVAVLRASMSDRFALVLPTASPTWNWKHWEYRVVNSYYEVQ